MSERESMVIVPVRMVEVEADGSNCVRCGDVIFRKAFEAHIYKDGRHVGTTAQKWCQSCSQRMREMG